MEKNVEMKDASDKKPENKKEEVKVPNDKYYGKYITHSNPTFRT